MIKLNFNFKLKDLDNNDIPDGEAAKIVSDTLAITKSSDTVKSWEYALVIRSKKFLELNSTSDFDFLINIIKSSENLLPLGKGQLILELTKQKDESLKEEKK